MTLELADLGVIVSVVVALAGLVAGVVMRDRHLLNVIRSGDDRLHERINRVRDEYARQDHVDAGFTRIDDAIKDLRSELQHQSSETTNRLDRIMQLLSTRAQGSQ